MHPDFENANLVIIIKKNDMSNVNNYHGISLLSVAGKLLSLIALNRIRKIIKEVLLESEYGFRPNRGTADMIFALHQFIQKIQEQICTLYNTFIHCMKAFDMINHEALWIVLTKMG